MSQKNDPPQHTKEPIDVDLLSLNPVLPDAGATKLPTNHIPTPIGLSQSIEELNPPDQQSQLKLEQLAACKSILYENQKKYIKFEDKDADSIFLSDINNLLYEYQTILKNYKKLSEAVKGAIADN